MGGASNAYTTYDHTAYYIHSAAPHTRRALTTLYEWVGSSRWTPDEFNRERGVILKEMDRAQHNVSRVMHQAFMVTNQWATNLHVRSITPLFDFGYFEIMIETQEDAALTVDRVQAVIDQLAWTRMSEAQLTHRVNQKRSDYVFGVSSLLDRVKNVGQGMIMGDNPQFFDYYSRQFSQVRANDIQRVVRHYLTPRKRHV